MNEIPFLFRGSDPLLIRPRSPYGFTLETQSGQILYASTVDFDHCKFHLMPSPKDKQQLILEVELQWVEG